jgi:hypothetical protein
LLYLVVIFSFRLVEQYTFAHLQYTASPAFTVAF